MTGEPHMSGGWTGTCPACGLHLQGRDATVVELHRSIVHPELVPPPSPPTPERATA